MKIAILISGRGSNMSALIEAVKTGEIPNSEIAVVISDKPDAAGLQTAREKGVDTIVIEKRNRTRREHDAETIAELKKKEVELICLAGYMRLLSAEFIEAFRNKIINIHPSLLPSFPGLEAQRQAFEYGVKFSGCTVHFVDEGLDSGAIIAQKVVPILNDDTPETLSARILEQEHRLYVETVAKIVSGKYEINRRRVIFEQGFSKDL
jgi:phosphoribosylglycinamide formyltransferase-1